MTFWYSGSIYGITPEFTEKNIYILCIKSYVLTNLYIIQIVTKNIIIYVWKPFKPLFNVHFFGLCLLERLQLMTVGSLLKKVHCLGMPNEIHNFYDKIFMNN